MTSPMILGSSSSNRAIQQLWDSFILQFPTKEHCLEELYRRARREGAIKCRHCRSLKIYRPSGGRVIKCLNCNRSTWLTAGTFFNHVRLPRAWLGAIWLMERGISISPHQFQKLAGVAYSTAWTIFKRLAAVLNGHLVNVTDCLCSARFSRVFCRRSRETPMRGHPVLEEKDLKADCASDPCKEYQEEEPNELNSQERSILDLLRNGQADFDLLCQQSGLKAGQLSSILSILEIGGYVIRKAGDRYIPAATRRNKPTASDSSVNDGEHDAFVFGFIDFVRGRFQGISRKYLQHFLALHWCHIDRSRWGAGALLKACLASTPIPYRDILSYVTPHMVAINPFAQ